MPAKPTDTYDASPSGAPGARAYLARFDEGGTHLVELRPNLEVTIGRSRSCGLRIEDSAVSRKHASVCWDGGLTVLVTDHGSHNGTFVDGERIEGGVTIQSGAEIAIGRSRIVAVVRPGRESRASASFPTDLVAFDPAMLRAIALTDRAARTDSNVLIIGETGTGKELLARRIHAHGPRASGPFVAMNCGAIPRELAEPALFGHARGAFTGAQDGRPGFFESAAGGTLFLDEVGELDPSVQAKLLRAIETRSIMRLGTTTPISVDVRFVAATHQDLAFLVREGRFREDLRYRIDVLRIDVPPLRERPGDVIPLAERFLAEAAGMDRLRFSEDARARLRAHTWPGNVRELRNAVQRAVALATGDVIRAADLEGVPAERSAASASPLSRQVEDVERRAIVAALRDSGGNRSEAARRLGISRRKLIYKLEKYGLKPPPARS